MNLCHAANASTGAWLSGLAIRPGKLLHPRRAYILLASRRLLAYLRCIPLRFRSGVRLRARQTRTQ
jgi:hypothetical protein